MQQQQSHNKLEEQIKKRYLQPSGILNLHKCKIWMDVLKSKNWRMVKLNKVILNQNSIKDEEFRQLVSLLPKSLEYIRISNCQITHRSIKYLADYDMQSLKELYLSKNCIGNAGAKWLVRCPLPILKQLSLIDCQINGEGFRSILKGKWPQLTTLYYNFATISSIFQQKHRQQK